MDENKKLLDIEEEEKDLAYSEWKSTLTPEEHLEEIKKLVNEDDFD